MPTVFFERNATDNEVVDVLPVPVAIDPVETDQKSALGLVELLLKSPAGVDNLINGFPSLQPRLIPRFLAIALTSYLSFTIALSIILNTAPGQAYPKHYFPVPVVHWANGSALSLIGAYNLGLVAATGICLPSFYFFGLLVGIRLTMLQIVAQVMRSTAVSALVLVGITPIYVAIVLGLTVFGAAPGMQEWWLYAGLFLPFLAGLAGVNAIYQAVLGMAETLPPERRCRRYCFLRRLTLSWSAVYTAVSPILIYRLWEYFAGLF